MRQLALALTVVLVCWLSAAAQTAPAVGQFLAPAYPYELVSAAKVDRIAWLAYEEGRRNVYTAAAPDFRPVRLTRFLDDGGIDLTTLSISADGSVVVFVRGHEPNRSGWVANVTSNPAGADRTVWAARTAAPGQAWRLAVGTAPAVSPDGRFAVYSKDGQIYRVRVTGAQAAGSPMDRGDVPLIRVWGTNGSPRWSPDSAKIAFVSERGAGAGNLNTSARVDFQVNVARFCQLGVGSTGATIDVVTFALTGANIPGAGGTVNATTNGTLAVRAASNTSNEPKKTVTTTGDLSDGTTNTIPWAKFSTATTSTTGTINAPVLGNGTSVAVPILRGTGAFAEGTFTFTFTNDTIYPAGTYGGVNTNNGRVTYTLACI